MFRLSLLSLFIFTAIACNSTEESLNFNAMDDAAIIAYNAGIEGQADKISCEQRRELSSLIPKRVCDSENMRERDLELTFDRLNTVHSGRTIRSPSEPR